MTTPPLVTPPQAAPPDPWAALGAQYEDEAPKAATPPVPVKPAPAKPAPDPWAAMGAQFEEEAPAATQPTPPAPVVAGAGPHNATMEASDPSLFTLGRQAVANSPIGHALQSGMPKVAAALHLEPTETLGSPDYKAHENYPALGSVVQGLSQEGIRQSLGEGAPHSIHPAEVADLAGIRPTTKQKPGIAQNVMTGAAESIGGLAAPDNLALMALPIGEVAGLTGKAVGAVLPRLVSAGFTIQMVKGLYDQAKQYKAARAAGDDEQAEQILGQMAITAPMIFAAGAHAMLGGGHAASTETPAMEHPAGKVTGIDQATGLPIVDRTAPASSFSPSNEGGKQEVTPAAAAAPAGVPRGETPPQTPATGDAIGQPEPETGRPILHASDDAEVNQEKATAEHPAVKSTLKELVKPIDGAKLFGDRAEKDPDRLEEKIEEEGQSPATARDYSGYRIAVDTPAARDQVAAALKQRFETHSEQDNFNTGDEEHSFHGHTLNVREPGSDVTHEVQILPREVAERADADHELYEKAREGDKAAAAELKAKNEENWNAFQRRQATAPDQASAGMPAAESSSGESTRPWSTDSVTSPEGTQARDAASQRSRPDLADTRSTVRPESVNEGGTSKLGAIDFTSQKMIHQPEGTVEQQMQRAREVAPQFESLLDDLAAKYGTTHSSVNLKGEERIRQKLDAANRPAHTLSDYIRARMPFNTVEDLRAAVSDIKRQYGAHDVDDFIDEGKNAGYRGVHMQIHLPNGQSAELQMVPREIYDAQEAAHRDYEIFRDPKATPEAKVAAFSELEKSLSEAWQKHQERTGGEIRYKFGNTQANIPADSPAAAALDRFRAQIPDEHLAGDGKDVGAGGNHVTVRYGIQGDDTAGIERYIASQPPFTARLGDTDVFPPTKNSDGAAVVHATVEAPELTRMNKEIEGHGDFKKSDFADYKPHATIAYIDPKLAESYKGRTDLKGKEFPVKSVMISDREGNQREIPLKGGRGESPETAVGAAKPPRPLSAEGEPLPPTAAELEAAGQGGLFGGAASEPARTVAPPPPPVREAAATVDRAQTGAAVDLKAGEVGRVRLNDLKVDPKRFQYKLNTDADGVTSLLKGRRWNDDLAGVISVWRDPADGKTYVVNGHHRYELARANNVQGIVVRMLNARDAGEARSIGALQNIAEGRGTPVDAAKFFRDTGTTAEQMEKQGVGMGEATAASGAALARLDDRLFDDVVSGKLGLKRGIAIGKATDVPAQQDAILKLIDKAEAKGRTVTDKTVDELARMVKGAGEHTATQETLFGTQEMTRNLALEKAEVSSYIREKIGQEKRLFASVADQSKAEKLAKGNNTINAAKNAEIAQGAAQAQELYDRFSTRAGEIDDILNRAASELASGKGNPNDVKARAYEFARAHLSETLTGGAGTRGERSEGNAGGGAAPKPPERAAQPAAAASTDEVEPGQAPAPPAPAGTSRWTKGDRFVLRDPATGKLTAGEVTYWNHGINGAKSGGRARLSDGTKLDEVPPTAVRVQTHDAAIAPQTKSAAETEMIARTKANLPQLTAEYLDKNSDGGVPTIATDAAKLLYPEYRADPTTLGEDVAAPSFAVKESALRTALAVPVDPARPDVLINMGSPGSGKTQFQTGGGTESRVGLKIEDVGSSFAKTSRAVQQVIDSGRRPVIEWVYVDDPTKTVERMAKRAVGSDERPGIGRTVRVEYMAEAYHNVPRTVERLAREFGDKIDIHVVDNSGELGAQRVSKDFTPFVEAAKAMPYSEIKEVMHEKLGELERAGLFDSAAGKDVLAAARAEKGGNNEARREQPAGGAGAGQESGRRVQGGPEEASRVLAPKAIPEAEFRQNLSEARKRSLAENAAAHKAEAIDTASGGKAVLMDADAYAVWHRAEMGEKHAWLGMTLPRLKANKAIVALRALAGSARAEAGGAEMASGYDRMVKAFQAARSEDGSITLLRHDYRPDTVREEEFHAWQMKHGMQDSDALRMVANSPEVKTMADQLRAQHYGLKPGLEGRTELALEMMAKAMAGDPDLHLTEEQRYDLTHRFLKAAAEEMGPAVLQDLPEAAPEAADAVREARARYGTPDEGSTGPEARSGGPQDRETVSRGLGGRGDSLHAGPEREPAAGRDERGAGQGRTPEGELGGQEAQPLYQRRSTGRLEGEQALPGMGEAVSAQDEAAAAKRGEDLTEEMRRPLGSIDKKTGEMERNSPLFSGTDANPQFSLFQRDNGTPLIPFEDRHAAADREMDARIDAARDEAAKAEKPQKEESGEGVVARSIQDLVDELRKIPRNDGRTALQRVSDWTGRNFDESTARAGKAWRSMPTKLQQAWAGTKLVAAALVDGFKNPLKETDWKKSVGEMQLARAETSQKLRKLAKAITEVAPDRLDRIGIAHWVEAGGDPRKLNEWAVQSKNRWETAKTNADMSPRLKDLYHDSIEHYDRATKLTPEQKQVAQQIKTHFDEMLQTAKENGLLKLGVRNYAPHLYERDGAANLIRLIDNSELNTNPAFVNERLIPTYWEAENVGLVPKNKDIGYLLTSYDKAFSEALASRTMLRGLLDAKASDGRPLAAIKTRGKWVVAQGDEVPLVLEQRPRPASMEGYREYDLPQTRNFLFEPTAEDLHGFATDPKLLESDPGKLAFKGDLVFHPEVAGRVEDMLTPGWFDRNESVPQKIGHAIMQGSGLAKELMTAVAPFHMVQEGVHSIEHKVNPFKLPEIDLKDKTQRLLASNGLSLTDFDAEGLFSARALKGLGEGIPGVNKAFDAMQSFSRWQFEDYIPKIKMKMAIDAFERNQKKYPQLSDRQVAELSAKEANAAFGNLNTAFDSMHRSKTFKQLLRLSLFAPDFLEARMRFVGQAFTRYGGEQRAALARGALVMYSIARITNAALNQGDAKWDPEQAFSIVVHGKAYSLRTVQGDILHAVTDPRGFIYNRLNPLTSRAVVEYLSGRDQMGRQKSLPHQARDVAKSVLPFGIQKVIQTSDEDWLNSILTSTGFQAKNYRTPAEEETHKLYLKSIPDLPDDEEREAASREHAQMEQHLREGKLKPADVWAEVKEGKLTPRQAVRTITRSQHSRLQNEFAALKLRDAMDVFEKANPVEKMELQAQLTRKAKGLEEIPLSDRQAMATRLRDLLAETHPMEKPGKQSN